MSSCFLYILLNVIIITTINSFTQEEDMREKYRLNMIIPINKTHVACDNYQTILPLSKINDDYCDCNDGADENKTNACVKGLFKCENVMYYTKILSTAKVNDGYCDCCDGSDEPKKVNCTNTCLTESRKEYDNLYTNLTTLKQVINSYSSEQNEAFFSYNYNGLKQIETTNELQLKLLKQKNLIYSYLRYIESKLTEENEDYVDVNNIKLAAIVKTLEAINVKIKTNQQFLDTNKHILPIYEKFGVFKDLSEECFDVKYDNYVCSLCFSKFSCRGETKENKPKSNYFGQFKVFNGNIATFENGNNCRNYNMKLSAEIVFECGFDEDFQFVAKINKCLYKFIYYSKIGCNSYKLAQIMNDVKDILH